MVLHFYGNVDELYLDTDRKIGTFDRYNANAKLPNGQIVTLVSMRNVVSIYLNTDKALFDLAERLVNIEKVYIDCSEVSYKNRNKCGFIIKR